MFSYEIWESESFQHIAIQMFVNTLGGRDIESVSRKWSEAANAGVLEEMGRIGNVNFSKWWSTKPTYSC